MNTAHSIKTGIKAIEQGAYDDSVRGEDGAHYILCYQGFVLMEFVQKEFHCNMMYFTRQTG